MKDPGDIPDRLTELLEVVEPRLAGVGAPMVLPWLAEISTARFCTNSEGVASISTESVYMPALAVKLAGCPNLHV
tara:strand:+ start:874 stop:1098 length:225 start_codon:yes stop_codon:yes gene_type:complete